MIHIHCSVLVVSHMLAGLILFAVGRAFRRSSDYEEGWIDAEKSGRIVFPVLKPGIRRWRTIREDST